MSIETPLRILSFFLLIFCIVTCGFYAQDSSRHIIVLTPQRCGTHWLLYSIQQLTKASVVNGLEKNGSLFDNNLNFDVFGHPINWDLSFLVHVHHPNSIIWDGYKKNKLILIIRNYKEATLRMFSDFTCIKAAIGKMHNDLIFQQLPPYYGVITWYFEDLEYYEQFQGDKFLIYYEELLLQPETIFKSLLSFLNASEQFLGDFMNHIESHKEVCLNFYNHYRFGSVTQGKDLEFHSKKLKVEELIEFDHLVQTYYPILWEKYLHRYQLKK